MPTFTETHARAPRGLRPSEKINILTKARNLLDTGWVKGTEFAKADGQPVDDPKNASRFCAIGAVKAVSPKRCQEVLDLLEIVAENKGFYGIDDLNDDPSTDRRDVVRAFNCAIKTVKDETNNTFA